MKARSKIYLGLGITACGLAGLLLPWGQLAARDDVDDHTTWLLVGCLLAAGVVAGGLVLLDRGTRALETAELDRRRARIGGLDNRSTVAVTTSARTPSERDTSAMIIAAVLAAAGPVAFVAAAIGAAAHDDVDDLLPFLIAGLLTGAAVTGTGVALAAIVRRRRRRGRELDTLTHPLGERHAQ